VIDNIALESCLNGKIKTAETERSPPTLCLTSRLIIFISNVFHSFVNSGQFQKNFYKRYYFWFAI